MRPALGSSLALLGAICLAAGISGCRGRRVADTSPPQVKVEVGEIGVDRQSGSHFVTLRDHDGRSLPIMVGDEEARAILLSMHGIRMERPLTAQLLGTIISTTGNHVDRVVVSELRGQTYYAYLELDDGRYRIDCRPSDAIALAMDTDAPIYVSGPLLQKASAAPPSAGQIPLTASRLGLTVQPLTPDLAGYFDAAPSSGLLVIDASGAAATAGVSRGDILLRVDDQPVTTLDEFAAAAARLAKGAPIKMVVRHAGAERTISFRMSSAPGA
jgi:bifunctional DNase/RNase